MALWGVLDGTLRRWSDALQRIVRLLRLVRVLLWLGVVLILASGVLGALAALGVVHVKWFLATYAIASLFVLVPLVAFAVLVGLPLKAKSVVRLVDQGYPENARELAIRVLARKLHEESIATEELLVETAWNETRKAMRRMEETRRAKAAEAAGEMAPASGGTISGVEFHEAGEDDPFRPAP